MENVKANIINKLTIQFNEHFYEKNEVYLTITIKFGFCTNKMLILPQKETRTFNKASGNVLIKYIQLQMKEKYNISVKGNVKTGMIYLSIKTKVENMDYEGMCLLKMLYKDKIDKNMFNIAKGVAKKRFSNNYKNVKFRAYYRMMEFVNINKGFVLGNLTKDFLDISLKDFRDFYEEVVVPQNSILFVNGDLSQLDKSKILKFIEGIETNERYIFSAIEPVNEYLQTNMHLIESAEEAIEIGAINFKFFNENIKMFEKQLLLEILSEIIFKDKGKVLVDEFDNSLLYFNCKLDKYSLKLLDYLNEETIQQAKTDALHKLSYILNNMPYVFNKYCIDLYSKGIDIAEYFEVLSKCDYKLITDIYVKGNLKITDGQLVYTKPL
ncbi:hypothetical protein [Clostridium felsineum]|uniref:hypothetical protein n=1 Tax=Clostridium felsineum TaxID=36839 RepID=UPI0009D2504A|nr:hypothetical protein [Clostridium felsineum]URZ03071.1 hypothetical protein CLAUR_031170 [Clostridium felsineum]